MKKRTKVFIGIGIAVFLALAVPATASAVTGGDALSGLNAYFNFLLGLASKGLDAYAQFLGAL